MITVTDLNAFITKKTVETTGNGVLSDAEIGVKDNISTKGIRTTCGSAMLNGYLPPYNATVVKRLLNAGAKVVGKTNMDEFGMGTTTETSAFGPTKNPVNTNHIPGGSSGGSAAAVAAGEVDYALGSDTGGSIRCPAAYCGVVGLKPTYGLVSRYGLIAYANSLEQIGPIAPTVETTGELLDVIAGVDKHDQTTRPVAEEASYAEAARQPVTDLSVGVPTELLDGADERVVETFWDAIDSLEAAGASYHEISMPSVESAVAAYYVIAMSEASSNLARFDGVRYGSTAEAEGDWNEVFSAVREDGFGEEVKRRILLGTYATSAGYHDKYYAKAQDARAWVRQEFDRAFDDVDVIASPTMPVLPFELGESIEDPMKMYLADANTTPVNLADLPAMSVPAGKADGLPVGLQLVGQSYEEESLLQAAAGVEETLD